MTAPYYQDDSDRLCECGCGSPVRKRFVSGHNRRGSVTSATHRARIGVAQRQTWATSRKRMPIGSRRKDVHGYWLIKTREHGGRWDKEHVLVAERELGRKLAPGEHVHHINCVRDDNRPENLVVLSSSDHRGAHASLNRLAAGLITDGILAFDRTIGEYRRG